MENFQKNFEIEYLEQIKIQVFGLGISVVMHMKNPHIPAMHFNTRYIYTSHGWFGGGMDVTPCIKDKKLEKWFHSELKKSCDKYNKNYYKNIKNGVMNIFIYHIEKSLGELVYFLIIKKDNWEKDFAFVREVGLCFKNVFREIILKKSKKKWTTKEKRNSIYKERQIC